MAHRDLKDRLYPEFARIGHALASGRRLEVLDLLAQGPRHVEGLARGTGMSVANVSQHLQVLLRARLVEREREGTKVRYRLAGDDVLRLWLALRDVAEARLAEVGRLAGEHAIDGLEARVPRAELQRRLRAGDAVVIDVRPREEYESGHLPGALALPIEELPSRLRELPRDKPIVAYCRGAYCLFADEAVALLRKHGYDARRIEGGWPEWVAEGRPAER